MADGSPRSALLLYSDACDLLEAAYQQSAGEETDDVAALEQLVGMQREAALEAYARFIRACEHGLDAVKVEQERLKAAKERIEKRQAWAQRELVALLERDGQTKATAGAFRISTRAGSKYVAVSPDLRLDALPPTLVRWPEPKPELDKVAAKEYLADPSSPRIAGLSLETKPRTVKID